ncbi:nucleotidyl transferase AbiEii/AbiGii toxin family protein [Clostridium malenominatum]|uniref:nucleotidyl transferase AbiEii/AbiGii toxin family protein n=1 Tax=Clostridium malenominatum TaxID=1539 RepID=UPI003CD05AF1
METVLAEKVETIISRDIANTRIRDFYDILWKDIETLVMELWDIRSKQQSFKGKAYQKNHHSHVETCVLLQRKTFLWLLIWSVEIQ